MQTVIRNRAGVRAARCAVMALFASAALATGGCGVVDGIELQGGAFDALGISADAQAKNKKVEQKVAARPGIVLPPNESRLPPPGTAPAPEEVSASGDSWPLEAEVSKSRAKAELDKRHKEYCETALRNARMKGEVTNSIQGPAGACQPSIFSGGLFGSSKQ